MPAKASSGVGAPDAETKNTLATNVVAYWVPSAANAGAVAAATATLTIWVATPVALLAVNVNVCVPASPTGGV